MNSEQIKMERKRFEKWNSYDEEYRDASACAIAYNTLQEYDLSIDQFGTIWQGCEIIGEFRLMELLAREAHAINLLSVFALLAHARLYILDMMKGEREAK
jgi:hypothetical protein